MMMYTPTSILINSVIYIYAYSIQYMAAEIGWHGFQGRSLTRVRIYSRMLVRRISRMDRRGLLHSLFWTRRLPSIMRSHEYFAGNTPLVGLTFKWVSVKDVLRTVNPREDALREVDG
jgi:hypothetical protein